MPSNCANHTKNSISSTARPGRVIRQDSARGVILGRNPFCASTEMRGRRPNRQACFSHFQKSMKNICNYLEKSAKIVKINDLRKAWLGNQGVVQSQVENQWVTRTQFCLTTKFQK